MKSTLACALLLVGGLGGCDNNYIAFTLDGGDAGSDAGAHDAGEDAGPVVAPTTVVTQCGDPLVSAITGTTTDIEVETSGAAMDSAALCGEPAGTQHVFMAIDALAGEAWHVHLSALDASGRPRMGLLTEACDPNDCVAEASFCEGGSDEHFSFEAHRDGRYWVTMNDAMTGGGRYRAAVYRLVCGDGVEAHGEACDDGNLLGGDGCDHRCRVELSTLRTHEYEPNDDRVGANVMLLEGGALTITGTIAGLGACAYPDVFRLAHPGGTLAVTVEADGACDSSGGEPMQARVMNGAGALLIAFDLTDCAGGGSISDLSAGEYSIEIAAGERDVALPYRLTAETL